MADVREYGADELVALLPLPADDANKYTRGRLVVVAGSARYPGAACLAACAGQRAGAGYTEVVCAPEAVDLVRSCRSSLVVRSWLGWGAADLPADAPGKPVAFALGPGFDAEDAACTRNAYLVLKHADAPVLVDGGALAALSTPKGRRLLKRRFVRGLPTVVTPHGGEAALAYGVVAVVKGPDTFVSDGDDVVAVRCGTPALAKAGTGDVLAGVLGAFLAQGLEPTDAAVLAATLHALAGRCASVRRTDIGVVAEDVVEALPEAVSALVALA